MHAFMGQEDKEVILLSKRGYFTLSLYALCLGVERKHFQETMHFHHATCMATPYHKNTCQEIINITVLVHFPVSSFLCGHIQ